MRIKVSWQNAVSEMAGLCPIVKISLRVKVLDAGEISLLNWRKPSLEMRPGRLFSIFIIFHLAEQRDREETNLFL